MGEVQENMRAMKSEEEEENHRDVRKLVETMQKKEEEQEEQRDRVAPNMRAPCRTWKEKKRKDCEG